MCSYLKTYLFVVVFCNSKSIDQFLSSLEEVPMEEIKGKSNEIINILYKIYKILYFIQY